MYNDGHGASNPAELAFLVDNVEIARAEVAPLEPRAGVDISTQSPALTTKTNHISRVIVQPGTGAWEATTGP